MTAPPTELRSTSDLVVATAWTLFIAATGGIFAALRPGSQAANTVISTPTANAEITGVADSTSGPSGIFMSNAAMPERSPTARPTPRAKPTAEATRPTTAASASTERVICLRDAPTARIRATSLVRWATSIVNVLEIRKTPTKSAMPAKPSRTCLRLPMPCSIWSACSSASALPVRASAVSGSSGSTAARIPASSAPGAATTVTSSK